MTTALQNHVESDEAHWQGHERVWAHVQQFPPKKTRSGWWLVLVGAVVVGLALAFI